GRNDIRIRIDSLSMADPAMHQYMVRGQIAGSDLERAGIYVDGKLAQDIPINRSPGMHASDFGQSFTALGSEATIRVYRSRRNFTVSSIDLASASTGNELTGPAVIDSTLGGAYGGGLNPGQLAVQITNLQAAAPSLYVVSGIISGRNVASAGIYQNGVMTS